MAQHTPEPYYDHESQQIYDASQIKTRMCDEKGRLMPPPPGPDFESYDPASGNWYDTEGGVWYNQKTQTIETLPYGKPPRPGERKARGGAP